jgi:hypothetical protein
MSGLAEEYAEVFCEYEQEIWTRIAAQTEQGVIEYTNTMIPVTDTGEQLPADAASVMEVVADFALAIRGIKKSEFSDEDASMSVMMEVAARESALHEGKRVPLPLEGDTEADSLEEQRLRKLYNTDPFDVEAMLDIIYARP